MRYLILCFFIICFSCKNPQVIIEIEAKTNENLSLFGYTLVDVFWDDPTDNSTKSNYLDEVADFSNIADLLVVNPSDDIQSRLGEFEKYELKAVLHLNEIFFEFIGNIAEKSQSNYDLRTDYKERWDEFISINNLTINSSTISCFYLGEEPTWNSISFEEFKLASDYIKATVPMVPILLVEAYPVLEELEVPTSVDWIAFDHYFIENPEEDETFLAELEILRSKKSADQKILLIMDAHYIDWAHGAFSIDLDEMGEVAENYYKLANKESDIIGLLAYHWPSGFDFNESIGARDFSEDILKVHRAIGKQICGK